MESMTNTHTNSIPTIEVRGPWSSTYTVNLTTMAVNLAMETVYQMEDTPDSEDAVTAATRILRDCAGDGSIKGFWGDRLGRLSFRQLAGVEAVAHDLAIAHQAGAYGGPDDLFEMFDGQH